MVETTGGPLRYISEAPSILASNLDLDKVNMKPTSTTAASSAGRPLSRAVAIVRTEMGRRGMGRRPLGAVDTAGVRARRAADRLPNSRALAGVQGGS